MHLPRDLRPCGCVLQMCKTCFGIRSRNDLAHDYPDRIQGNLEVRGMSGAEQAVLAQ